MSSPNSEDEDLVFYFKDMMRYKIPHQISLGPIGSFWTNKSDKELFSILEMNFFDELSSYNSYIQEVLSYLIKNPDLDQECVLNSSFIPILINSIEYLVENNCSDSIIKDYVWVASLLIGLSIDIAQFMIDNNIYYVLESVIKTKNRMCIMHSFVCMKNLANYASIVHHLNQNNCFLQTIMEETSGFLIKNEINIPLSVLSSICRYELPEKYEESVFLLLKDCYDKSNSISKPYSVIGIHNFFFYSENRMQKAIDLGICKITPIFLMSGNNQAVEAALDVVKRILRSNYAQSYDSNDLIRNLKYVSMMSIKEIASHSVESLFLLIKFHPNGDRIADDPTFVDFICNVSQHSFYGSRFFAVKVIMYSIKKIERIPIYLAKGCSRSLIEMLDSTNHKLSLRILKSLITLSSHQLFNIEGLERHLDPFIDNELGIMSDLALLLVEKTHRVGS